MSSRAKRGDLVIDAVRCREYDADEMDGRFVRAALGLVIAVVVLICGLGCGRERREFFRRNEAKNVSSVVDALGREIRLEKEPDRLISLAPSITEILFALGLGQKVVGVTTWDDYPPEVTQIQRVGDYGNPSLEKIVWLKPDLVLVTYGVPKPSIVALEKHGLLVMALPDDSLQDVVESIRLVGRACLAEQQSEQLASSLERRIAAVAAKMETLGPSQRPKVLFLVSLTPLMCAASQTFIDDIIAKAGAVNLGAKFGKDYPNLSAELLIKERPDVLFLGEYVEKAAEREEGKGILRTVGLSDCPTYTIPDDLIQRPGPRAVEGLELMARTLHPEAFGTSEGSAGERKGRVTAGG